MEPSPYVTTRTFGDARVSLISDGSGRSTIVRDLLVPEAMWRAEVPEADDLGEITVGYNCALIETGGARVLVDLGFDDPGPHSMWRPPRHQRSPGLVAGLRALGFVPDEISHVIVTHGHGDHFAGASEIRDGVRQPRFPRARHTIGRADWDTLPARHDPHSLLSVHLGTVARAGLLDPIDGDRTIVPGIDALATPGESPGHLCVRVVSGGARFYFVGDLFHHPCEVRNLSWVSRGRDAAIMERSRRRMLADAGPDATWAFTHRPFPAWGQILPEGDGYRWIDRP